MVKKIQQYLFKLKVLSFYSPVTIKGTLFFAVLYLSVVYLNNSYTTPTSSYSAVIKILIKVSTFFIGTYVLMALAFISLSWLYLLYYKNKKKVQITIEPLQSQDLIISKAVKFLVSPCQKPILGFIQIRMFYDDKKCSSKYILHTIKNQNTNTNFKSVEGIYYWGLPEVKEYKIEKTIVYFEDIFQFFSLVVPLSSVNRFITHPQSKRMQNIDPTPRKTEETTNRIEQMRRVEGEYLNYKNFESNDDVRRIVWKVYAKNKELIVRIPEILDPYASHVYMYPSFYSRLNVELDTVVNTAFLNYYKTIIWSVYNNMIKKGYNVQYIADNVSSSITKTDNQDNIKQLISTAKWQSEKSLRDFIQFNDASVVIVSSLSDLNDVKELSERYGKEINFIYVKLTDYLNQKNIIDWIEWLFLFNEDANMEEIKRKWLFSTFKSKLRENETSIEKFLPPIQLSINATEPENN